MLFFNISFDTLYPNSWSVLLDNVARFYETMLCLLFRAWKHDPMGDLEYSQKFRAKLRNVDTAHIPQFFRQLKHKAILYRRAVNKLYFLNLLY